MVSLSAAVGALIVTITMRTSRFFAQHVAGAFAVAVVGALLIGGMANAAPPAGTPVGTVSLAAPAATTTTLVPSPVSPVAQGTLVTLTAAVMPETAVGTVQFKDGTTNIGDRLPVTNGTARGTVSTLAPGSHQLSAVFTPTDTALFSPSTSPTVPFVVNAPAAATAPAPATAPAAAAATSTTLTTSPTSSVVQGNPVKLNATVTPATAAGTVQFKDGTTDIGKKVPVTNGTASTTTSRLAVGSRQLTAVFTPTDPAAFSSSTSEAVSLTVTESGGGGLLRTNPQAQQSGQSLDGVVVVNLDRVLDGLVVVDLDGQRQSSSARDDGVLSILDGLVVVDLGGQRQSATDQNSNDRNSEGLLDGLVSGVLDGG